MTLQCTSCGAPIVIEPNQESVKCEYCKTETLLSVLLCSQSPTLFEDVDRVNKRLRRAGLCLLDGEPDKAEALYEQILEEAPENAQAYIGLLLVRLQLREEQELASYCNDLASYQEFCRAREFATGAYKQQLEQWYIQSTDLIIYRRKKNLYTQANEKLNEQNAESAIEAEALFLQLGDFEDAAQMAVLAAEKSKEHLLIEEAEQRAEHELKEQQQRASHKSTVRGFIILMCIVGSIFIFGIGYNLYDQYVALPREMVKIEALLAQSRFGEAVTAITGSEHAISLHQQLLQAQYGQAQQMENKGFYTRAWLLYMQVGDYENAKERAASIKVLAQPLTQRSSMKLALRSDGTVDCRLRAARNITEETKKQMRAIAQWRDIVKITAAESGIIGLKENGSIVYTGEITPASNWGTLVNIDAYYKYTAYTAYNTQMAGLRQDGTVVAINMEPAQHQLIASWTNVKNISCGEKSVTAVTSDGKVLSSVPDEGLQAIISGWSDMVAVATETGAVVGLRNDGTVWAACNKEYTDEWLEVRIPKWNNITNVSVYATYASYTIEALTADGKIQSFNTAKHVEKTLLVGVGIFHTSNWCITEDGYIPRHLMFDTYGVEGSRRIW